MTQPIEDKSRRTPVESLFLWVKVMAAVGSLAILSGVVTGAGLVITEHHADERTESERLNRSVESCKNFNKDQTNDRLSFIGSIGEMAVDFFGQTEEEAQDLLDGAGGQKYRQFIEQTNPYRDCRVLCVVAFLDADIEDCPPAKTEAGNT